ncbi:MAG TPA: DNA polymerase III subunit alpha [Firmicutes bacterium]|nr:DNA polymerase III subunit alpha [Bacillota bacterium]
MGFVQLQVRSSYSLLKSTIQIKELIDFAVKNQFSTLSLVEEGSFHSGIKFYSACLNANIKPIFGLSVNVSVDSFQDVWTLMAKNNEGYEALMKLATVDASKSLTHEDIVPFAKDLILITDGDKGVLPTFGLTKNESAATDYVQTYLKAFPHKYIGLIRIDEQTYHKSLGLIQIATKLNLNVVALNDVRYLHQEGAKTLNYLRLIDENSSISDEPLINEERYYKTEVQMRELFRDCEAAIEATVAISEQCQVVLELGVTRLPKFPTADDIESQEYLSALCHKGLHKRYGKQLSPTHYHRLEYELSVIQNMGFSDYFLIVWDFIKYAKLQGIYVGCGRGSAAGSLVAYVLGITNVDPIKYDLLFERFLNPERISMPDIDIDFQDNRRDEVIQYVQTKYGANCVVQIVTFGTFQARSSWRDLARIHEIETTLINKVSSYITSNQSLRSSYEQSSDLSQFLEQYPKLKFIYEEASKIEGLPRHTSIHAAGVIISEHDLTAYTALMPSGNGLYLSQYEAEDLEKLGLLKMDFLGLKNLTMLQQIVNLVKKNENPTFDLSQISFDDAKTYELIASGHTTGVFQLESEGMKHALKVIKPTELEDIIACNALFRPGPMENIPKFADIKNGKSRADYYHEVLVPILRKTHGIIVYQEQIMQIAHAIGGYSLGEADVLRRAVSKKKADVLVSEQEKFITRAISHGYSKELASFLYDLILKFANYGFNRSHAVAYSMIAYQMAYLKTHYPAYFMTVALSSVIGSEFQTALYIKEARSFNLSILPPSVNHSEVYYFVENGNIRFSLLPIKNVGQNIAKQLIAERNHGRFVSYFDFVSRCSKFINQKVFESLIDVGALDEFGLNRNTLHQNLKPILDFSKYNGGLFDADFAIMPCQQELTKSELMNREKQLLGFYLNSHPIKMMYDEIKKQDWVLPSTIHELDVTYVNCVGYVERLREIRDKKGNLMCFLELSDENSSIPVTIFSDSYKKEFKEFLGKVIVIKGRISVRNGEKNLNFSKLLALS